MVKPSCKAYSEWFRFKGIATESINNRFFKASMDLETETTSLAVFPLALER